jgi:hypothetical protein
MNDSRVKTLLAVLPVLSAGLYLFGTSYSQGYLATFGIEDSMFPVAVDRLLISGFLAFITFSLMPIMYGVGAVAALIGALIFAAVISSFSRVQHWQSVAAAWFGRFHLRGKPIPAMNALIDKSESFWLYVLGIVFIYVWLLTVMFLSHRTGIAQARLEIDNFAAGKDSYISLTADQLPLPIKAKQIICGTTYCAFWLGNETVILKHEQIKKIVTHTPSPGGIAAGK